MITVDYFTLHLALSKIRDTRVLDIIGSGIMVALSEHKDFNSSISDSLVLDKARFTMGDHAAELHDGTDVDFEYLYNNGCDGLDLVLAGYSTNLVELASYVSNITDFVIITNPGILTIAVREVPIGEGDYATGGIQLY